MTHKEFYSVMKPGITIKDFENTILPLNMNDIITKVQEQQDEILAQKIVTEKSLQQIITI